MPATDTKCLQLNLIIANTVKTTLKTPVPFGYIFLDEVENYFGKSGGVPHTQTPAFQR